MTVLLECILVNLLIVMMFCRNLHLGSLGLSQWVSRLYKSMTQFQPCWISIASYVCRHLIVLVVGCGSIKAIAYHIYYNGVYNGFICSLSLYSYHHIPPCYLTYSLMLFPEITQF